MRPLSLYRRLYPSVRKSKHKRTPTAANPNPPPRPAWKRRPRARLAAPPRIRRRPAWKRRPQARLAAPPRIRRRPASHLLRRHRRRPRASCSSPRPAPRFAPLLAAAAPRRAGGSPTRSRLAAGPPLRRGRICVALSGRRIFASHLPRSMDFHKTSRRKLQALCKRNGVRANVTNDAMIKALEGLSSVDGIEEIGTNTPGCTFL
ncbi:uncharacterized protein [Miscanthus floridulus]|uniref:uncharacterized protein n=1 Tax=Miscanthus floridulus TaxID=154761 RepID=UPI003458F61F